MNRTQQLKLVNLDWAMSELERLMPVYYGMRAGRYDWDQKLVNAKNQHLSFLCNHLLKCWDLPVPDPVHFWEC